MNAIEVEDLTYQYGAVCALDALNLTVPQGSLYALLGPNGSGKTTLMQILAGLRRVTHGRVELRSRPVASLTMSDRQRFTYIAENQQLPSWMRLEQYETYLAPLYPAWDFALANSLRTRFELDPKIKLGTLSRGSAMKAALLCALAPRPELMLMDEPFTGMDAVVKDDIVSGLLDSAGQEGCTMLICSHDLPEVDMLADWVGIMQNGRMLLSEPMDSLRERVKRVEITNAVVERNVIPSTALQVEQRDQRTAFLVTDAHEGYDASALRTLLPSDARVVVRDVTLREIFVAIARTNAESDARIPTETSLTPDHAGIRV